MKKNRGIKPEKKSASPTVASERIMINLVIEANEERDVATVDIPEEYLHTKND